MSERLKAIEAKRAAARAAEREKADEQKATDLEAIFDLEALHGADNISTITVPYTEGLPVVCAVRTPVKVELKRFRDQMKTKLDRRNVAQVPDHVLPNEQLAAVCLVYPDGPTFEKLCDARPGLAVQLGQLAYALGVGAEEADLKD
jgi:hypothetical protein